MAATLSFSLSLSLAMDRFLAARENNREREKESICANKPKRRRRRPHPQPPPRLVEFIGSAWVDFFNGHPSPEAEALTRLIREEADVLTCGVIVAEVLQGLRQTESLAQIEQHFLDMEWLTPREPETYVESASLYRHLRSKGVTIRSTIDCVIAKLADENDVLLLSKDRDLRMIIESGLLNVRALPIA